MLQYLLTSLISKRWFGREQSLTNLKPGETLLRGSRDVMATVLSRNYRMSLHSGSCGEIDGSGERQTEITTVHLNTVQSPSSMMDSDEYFPSRDGVCNCWGIRSKVLFSVEKVCQTL